MENLIKTEVVEPRDEDIRKMSREDQLNFILRKIDSMLESLEKG